MIIFISTYVQFLRIEPVHKQSCDRFSNFLQNISLRLAFDKLAVESCLQYWEVMARKLLMDDKFLLFRADLKRYELCWVSVDQLVPSP